MKININCSENLTIVEEYVFAKNANSKQLRFCEKTINFFAEEHHLWGATQKFSARNYNFCGKNHTKPTKFHVVWEIHAKPLNDCLWKKIQKTLYEEIRKPSMIFCGKKKPFMFFFVENIKNPPWFLWGKKPSMSFSGKI